MISSRPSEPCTTQTDLEPRFFSTCASGCTHWRENTPTICLVTPAGLDSGPSRLKIVRVASSTRVGPTFFMAGWWEGANMKPIPASETQRPTCSGLRSIFTPSEDSTSAAPERDDSARLPCLATGTPAPATMKEAQVDTLTEPEPSPPVPTTSIASAGALTCSILARIAETAPVISSTVSPRTRKRHQQSAHLRRRGLAGHHAVEGGRRLLARQGRAGGDFADDRFEVVHRLLSVLIDFAPVTCAKAV